jgi:hypothetical protein
MVIFLSLNKRFTKEGEPSWHRPSHMMATNPTNNTQCSTSTATTMHYMDKPLMSYTAKLPNTILATPSTSCPCPPAAPMGNGSLPPTSPP